MARKIVAHLKKAYPAPKTELLYETHFQLVVAVILSAQCTDKVVNRVTHTLFQKYKHPRDFATARHSAFEQEISSITFYRNKTKHIIEAAKRFSGLSFDELVALPGVGYKTAHVIRGELLGEYDGIPTDTHVKRFARRFGLTKHTDLKKISKDLEALVPKRDWKYVNNGLVLYGRYTCPARAHDCRQHALTRITKIGAGPLQKVRKA
ncbi:MAG: endonuclease III [Patescibacteria group bacterium]